MLLTLKSDSERRRCHVWTQHRDINNPSFDWLSQSTRGYVRRRWANLNTWVVFCIRTNPRHRCRNSPLLNFWHVQHFFDVWNRRQLSAVCISPAIERGIDECVATWINIAKHLNDIINIWTWTSLWQIKDVCSLTWNDDVAALKRNIDMSIIIFAVVKYRDLFWLPVFAKLPINSRAIRPLLAMMISSVSDDDKQYGLKFRRTNIAQ
jgi:hypothetical protein